MSLALLGRAPRVHHGYYHGVVAIVSPARQQPSSVSRRLYSIQQQQQSQAITQPKPSKRPPATGTIPPSPATPSTQPRRAASSPASPPARTTKKPVAPASSTPNATATVPAAAVPAPAPVMRTTGQAVATAPGNKPAAVVVPAPRFSPSLNPPVTTRPAELLSPPERVPGQTKLSHLMSKGKGILTFYKTGIKHIVLNTKLVWGKSVMPPPPPTMPRIRLPWDKDLRPPEDEVKGQRQQAPATGKTKKSLSASGQPASQDDPALLIHPPQPGSRAHLQLRRRWRHDIIRLPVFVVILILWGEMTPLALILFPSLSPTVCRMPVQIDRTLKKAEDRRATALRNLAYEGKHPLAPWVSNTHALRALNLNHRIWDRVDGMAASYQTGRLHRHLRYLAQDGALILAGGGPAALETGELYIACAERGIDVRLRKAKDLRPVLLHWLKLTMEGCESVHEVMFRMKVITGWFEHDWPPEWPGWKPEDVREEES